MGHASCRQFQLRAHAFTITLLPDCSNEQRIAADTPVPEEVRRLAIVRDEEIQIAIVADVARCQPTTDLLDGEAGSRAAAHIGEASARDIPKQLITLRVGGPGAVSEPPIPDWLE